MIRKILVPAEFTYLSSCALKLGLQLAKLSNAEVKVTSVVEPFNNAYMDEEEKYSHDPMSSIKNLRITEEARAKMHERAEEIAKWFPDQVIAPKILYGDKVDTLVNEVHDQKIDLVIMGGDLYDEKDQRSNAFLRKSESPVVILKCMINQLDKFRDIIFLADIDQDSEKLVDYVKELQELLQAKIHVLRINTPKNFLAPKKCSETLDRFIARNKLTDTVPVSLDSKSEMQGLMDYCDTIENAFVCMGVHDRNFLQSLITNSIKEEEIIANSAHPVWTYKE